MAVDWINEDLTFADGFEQHLPEPLRDYAKGAKDLPALIKRGADTQREFHGRVKLPTEPAEREQFLAEHFGKDLEARETARQEKEAADQKKAGEEAATTAAGEQAKRAEAAAKALKEKHGAQFEANLELVRRAFRSEHTPQWIAQAVAKAVGVEPGKVTDEQVKSVFQTDPAMFEVMLTIGKLSQDGRMARGDGHSGKTEEQLPAYPLSPEVYSKCPDGDKERQWFVNRGAVYQDGRYLGGFSGKP